ncbi:hypothetical protein DFH27DRAFT_344738 [Peziza echinospora]|nr:hypothetical protein DFH27DRAFT_344738 [Peziza echinospora]
MLKSNAADVSNLKDLGLTEKDAIDCLKACNNDVDKAAEYYFSGDLEKNRKNISWDESAFHSDRYDNLEPLEPLTGWGPQNVNNSPHYSIQGPDVLSNDAMGPRPSSPMNSGMNDANRG